MIDSFVCVLLVFVLLFIPLMAIADRLEEGGAWTTLATLYYFGIFWIYFAAMESSSRQGTLGKMAVGIKVTDVSGGRVSFGRASARFFAKPVCGVPTAGLSVLMAAFTKKKQCLHDMMAGSLVVDR